MNSAASETTPEQDPANADPEKTGPDAAGLQSGDEQETKWEVVIETAGLATAEIIVGRLKAEGIPAKAWQEGAGQAFGLTVGLLGTGYVMVPEGFVDQARSILDTPIDEDGPADEATDDQTTSAEE